MSSLRGIEVASGSIVGKRPYNEDRLFSHVSDKDVFVGVYDGHGGEDTACLLRDKLYPTFKRYLKRMSVEEAFETSYDEIDYLCGSLGHIDCGSTSVNCYIREENESLMIYTANVGDSEAMICSDRTYMILSTAHNEDNPKEKKRIYDLGGHFRNGYVMGELNMTRAVGDYSVKKYVHCNPSLSKVDVGYAEYVVLASDGLFDVLNYNDIHRLITRSSKTLKEKVDLLIRSAYDRGSSDNITVVLLHIP